MVRRKNRNASKSKTVKIDKPLKENNHSINGKDKKIKTHANRDSHKSYAVTPPSLEVTSSGARVPTEKYKPHKPMYANEKGKRQRKDPDLPFWSQTQTSSQLQTNIPKAPTVPKKVTVMKSRNKGANENIKTFELGHGAKSTVKMPAISNNRFVMLHEEEDDKQNMEIGTVNASLPSQGDNQEVVPETQPESMAV